MSFNPSKQKTVILGLQGSGKTYFSKRLVEKNNLKVVVFSPHRHDWEEEGDNFYFWNGNFPADIEVVLHYTKALCLKGVVDGILIDEMDVVFRNNHQIKEVATDVIANHRHYDMLIMGIARGYTDIPAYYRKQCMFTVAFALDDPITIQKLNQLYPRFGDMVRELNYHEREYALKMIAMPPQKMSKMT